MPSLRKKTTCRPPFKSTLTVKKESTTPVKKNMSKNTPPAIQKKGSPKKSNVVEKTAGGSTSSSSPSPPVLMTATTEVKSVLGKGSGQANSNTGKQQQLQTKTNSNVKGKTAGKSTKNKNEDSRLVLTAGPPPEPGTGRRTSHQYNRQRSSRLHAGNISSPQPMRGPSLRRPSSFVTKRPSVLSGGLGGKGSVLPQLGVQSYQAWVNTSKNDSATKPQTGPSHSINYRAKQGVYNGVRSGTAVGSQTYQQKQQQFVPPQPLLDPALKQTLLSLQSLIPVAVTYLEANPEIDQALGLLVSHFCQGQFFSSMQQPQQSFQPQPVFQQMSNMSRCNGKVNGNGNGLQMPYPNYGPSQLGMQFSGGKKSNQQPNRQTKTPEGAWNKRKSNAASTSRRGKSN